MTPKLELQTFTTAGEPAGEVDALAAIIDLRIAATRRAYDQRWRGLAPSVRDWLREVIDLVLADVRRDVLAIARDLLSPRVH